MDVQLDDDRSHPAIVSDLLDLQARLRGEPATLVRPGTGLSADELTAEDQDPPNGAHDHDVSRIEALRRRLASLELEIEAYEAAVAALPPTRSSPGVVLAFRRPGEGPDLR